MARGGRRWWRSWIRWLLRLGEFPLFFLFILVEGMLTLYDSILCSDYAIKRIDEPFIKEGEDLSDWAL